MFHAADLLSNRARLDPDREALLDLHTRQRFTYADLNRRANRLANVMHDELGIRQGDRVSILAQNSVVYLDLFYGLAKIGAIFAPLNWRLVARELAYIVNDCTPRVLIVGPDYVPVAEELLPQVQVEHVLTVEGAQLDGARSYEDAVLRAPDTEPERPALDSETPYAILYTSGTTGLPKGAVIPHRQILYNCLNTSASWGLSDRDVSPVFTPLFHAGGLFAFLTPIFYLGGRIILGRAFDVQETLRVIIEEKCTVILGVPTIFQMWMDTPGFDDLDFGHVHFFISGGAPCPPTLMQAWRERKGVVFRQGYGLTEVGANCFSMTDEESVPKTGSVGKPIFHSQMRLVDENGHDVPAGETGELLIAGRTSVRLLAQRRLPTKCWWMAGSIQATWPLDEDGSTIVGRAKDMLISGGENIYAAEVSGIP
jgi:fatty-acyl-CoA synthase